MKRYKAVGLIILMAILTGAALVYLRGAAATAKVIAPGTEAFSVMQEEVMSMTFSTSTYRLTAQRATPGAPFVVHITFADGRNPQHCQASPDLAGQLEQLTVFTVKRQIASGRLEVEFPTPIGSLDIQDRILPETSNTLAFRASNDRRAVALAYDGYAVEVGTPATAFAKFNAGCKALGLPRTTR
ncbi:MAG: hypothetical protein ABWY27_09445 [Telluria sp.]